MKSTDRGTWCSPLEALGRLRPHSNVVVGHSVAEPSALLRIMVENREMFTDINLIHMNPKGECGYLLQPGMEGHFRHTSFFSGRKLRRLLADGRVDFIPAFFSEIPGLFRTVLRPDAVLVQVAPPDERGFCNLGVCVDYMPAAIKEAGLVIAEVNDQMPRTFGETNVHVSELDCLVGLPHPVIEEKRNPSSTVELSIGGHCADLIEDGATLQLGIGAIPDAVLASLRDKRDLGIHSEMISDGVMELLKAGVITNARKKIHPGVCVVSFLSGSKKFYDFVDRNPLIELYAVDYVNNPAVIMRNDKAVAVNSAIEVDFSGQVCAESIGPVQISGVGGQVDFVRGAAMSRGGKSVIALPSTAAGGSVSRIVPRLSDGACVTTSRNDVDYVVTEYGAAALKGKTLKQRARALIAVAHPSYRDFLSGEYRRLFPRDA